jgi:hypothetical protein
MSQLELAHPPESLGRLQRRYEGMAACGAIVGVLGWAPNTSWAKASTQQIQKLLQAAEG